jgi:hypothetical protein
MFLFDVYIIVMAESCRNYFLSLLFIVYLFVLSKHLDSISLLQFVAGGVISCWSL